MTHVLAIDADTLYALANVRLAEPWFVTFPIPDSLRKDFQRKEMKIDGSIFTYLISKRKSPSADRLLVIRKKGTGIFSEKVPVADVFRRIMRVGLN